MLIYILAGFTLVSNFKAFLLGATPLSIIYIILHLGLKTHMPIKNLKSESESDFD